MPVKKRRLVDVQAVVQAVIVLLLVGVLGAAVQTFIEVRLLRRDVDELRKDLDRLWVEASDNVADLQTTSEKLAAGHADPAAVQRLVKQIEEQLTDRYAPVFADYQARQVQDSSIAAAAAPAAPPPAP